MWNAAAIVQLQTQLTALWHASPSATLPADPLLSMVATQHRFNYDLWHQEDIARSHEATDTQIAAVKRAIDRLNQSRNDWIEKLDDALTETLVAAGIREEVGRPFNSETPGSIVDRMSIAALRIYHLDEQSSLQTDENLREQIAAKARRSRWQLDGLSRALDDLVADLMAGRKSHRTYRQHKMYNDSRLNPYLNGQKRLAA